MRPSSHDPRILAHLPILGGLSPLTAKSRVVGNPDVTPSYRPLAGHPPADLKCRSLNAQAVHNPHADSPLAWQHVYAQAKTCMLCRCVRIGR